MGGHWRGPKGGEKGQVGNSRQREGSGREVSQEEPKREQSDAALLVAGAGGEGGSRECRWTGPDWRMDGRADGQVLSAARYR